MVTELAPAALAARARRVRVVLSDVDGVLTDAGVYYSEHGEALKRFSLRDGMGVERLREAGIRTGFVTRERSPIVERRAEKLGIELFFQGIRDKEAHLPEIVRQAGVTLGELAYVGDDVNDLGIMRCIAVDGLVAAPSDAVPEVSAIVHHRALVPGGYGAFRDVAEWILRLRRVAGTE